MQGKYYKNLYDPRKWLDWEENWKYYKNVYLPVAITVDYLRKIFSLFPESHPFHHNPNFDPAHPSGNHLNIQALPAGNLKLGDYVPSIYILRGQVSLASTNPDYHTDTAIKNIDDNPRRIYYKKALLTCAIQISCIAENHFMSEALADYVFSAFLYGKDRWLYKGYIGLHKIDIISISPAVNLETDSPRYETVWATDVLVNYTYTTDWREWNDICLIDSFKVEIEAWAKQMCAIEPLKQEIDME